MKTTLSLITIIILGLLFPIHIFSQQKLFPHSVKKGRLFTSEGFEIKFKGLQEEGDFLFYTSKSEGFKKIEKSKVLRIEQRKGNEGLKWGTITFVSTALTSWLAMEAALARQNANRNAISNKEKIALISTTAIISGVIGFSMGATKKRYLRIYDDPEFGWNPPKLELKFSTLQSSILSINFIF